jgi:hypothetical protein
MGSKDIPVTHDKSIPSPLLPEDVGDDLLVLADMCAVDLVVRGHDASRGTDAHGELEWHQIDLAHGAHSHDAIHCQSLVLLIIADEMLQRRRNALLLDTLGHVAGQVTGQHAVFGK